MKIILKRIISFVLTVAIVLGMVPSLALNTFASEDTVYISVSYDEKYIQNKNGEYMANVPVKLSDIAAINLDNYELSEYKYDGDGDGINEITALHLIIYAHENLYGGKWSDVSFTGDPGSSYFAGGIFGFDENLNYFHNGEFPIDEKLTVSNGYVTGATSDRIVLTAGDHLDIAGFTSYDFYQDSNFGFHKFADINGDFNDNYNTVAGETTTVKLVRSYSGMGSGATVYEENGYTIYYGSAYGEKLGAVTTDDSGCAYISFPSAGTYYIWCDGGCGLEYPESIVSTPAYAIVDVETSSLPTTAPNNVPVLTENFATGTGTVTITIDEGYSINLAEVFNDVDGDTLTYYCNDTALTDAVYEVAPTETGTQTLVFKANDTKAESATYTVTLTVNEAVKQSAKLASFVLYRQGEKNKPLIAAEEAVLDFSPETKEYIITQDLKEIQDRNNNTLYFCAVPEDENYIVTLYCTGHENGVDIKSVTNVFKSYKFITGGKNEFKLVVSSPEENIESTTYNFTVYAIPTLATKTTVESIYPVYLDKNLSVNTKSADITVPSSLKKIKINVVPKSEGCTVTYNGETSNTVNIENKDKIEIVVSKDKMSETYTFNLKRESENFVTVNTVPEDAQVKISVTYKGSAKNYVLSKDVIEADDRYPLIFNKNIQYSYTVTKNGYTPTSGTITNTDEVINVTLTKEIPTQPEEIKSEWKNFRNSDVNMAITSAKTPTEKIALKWNKTLGTGWGSSPSVPIIVDNKIVVMSGKKLYMLDTESGESIKEADMVSFPNYGYTPPTYANGMIFCPLSNGIVQAFNATTFESLWVYTDPLGGQALSPITYSTSEINGRTCGYIYTGLWNGESGIANYVCIDVTDYDADKKTEPKTAVWSHTQNGGFYWAGSVVVDNAVIVGTDDGGAEGTDAGSYLYSFNKITGEIITKLALASDAGDQRSSIAYDKENGKIYFTTKGGYLYSAKVNSDGAVTDLKGVNYNAQITSTPVVYKGKVYFGIGSGIRTDGSEGSFVVADSNTLEKMFSVEMKGYPQASALLSTAYEKDGYLYFYMTYNDRPGGISMLKVKNDAQSSADIQLTEIYEAEGFNEFCIASIVCDENGTLYYKNDSGNFFAVAPATYKTVIKLINKIGTVTLESESAIKAAREAYEDLEESEKSKVTNLDVLLAAEKELENFLKADEVDKLISNIGYATINNGKRIKEARQAYNKLTDYQKTLVKNYARLLELEKEYNRLVDEAVKKVEDLINSIGEVTLESGDDIIVARRAYNQLPPHIQKLVSNLDKLEKAEKEYKKLREEALELIRNGKTVLTKSELLKLQDEFENVTEKTKYDDALALLITYFKLGEKQQLALADSEQLELLKTIVAKQNHENPSTGITMYGLEWNIKVKTDKLPEKDEHIKDDIVSKLEGAQILTIWDIHLEDVLTGKGHTLDDVVEVCIPVELVGDYTFYDKLGVVHYADDGSIEMLNCKVIDGYVVFNAVDFSYYAIVGFMDTENESEMTTGTVVLKTQEYEELIEKAEIMSETNSSWLVWVGTAGVGIILLAVLLFLKRRMSNEA